MSFKKNTAVTGFPFGLVSATDGSAIIAGTPVIYVTLDGLAQATVVGAAVHEGNGQWTVNLTAAEMNGDIVGILCTVTGGIPAHFTIKTDTKIVSELLDFNSAVDTVANVTLVATTTTNTDMRGTDGANTTVPNTVAPDNAGITANGVAIAALNNVAATDIVSAGAITTLAGAVVNVDLVDTTTTNTDMRGTDGANTAVPNTVAPDNAGITANGVAIAALNDLSAANVNAEVVDALNVDTYAEPGQGAPAATASIAAKVGYLYKVLRNKKTATATSIAIYDDSGVVIDHKRAISDDETTYTEDEIVTGP